MLSRTSISGVLAFAMTLSLLMLMNALVEVHSHTPSDQFDAPTFLGSTIVTPPAKRIEEEPPEPIIKPAATPVQGPPAPEIRFVPVRPTANPNGHGLQLGVDRGPAVSGEPIQQMSDQPLVTIISVPPAYPQRLLQRGTEGYVDVRYDVNAAGNPINPVVVYSTHKGFERSALNAIERFRYQPRVVNGQALETVGVEKRFTFEIEL